MPHREAALGRIILRHVYQAHVALSPHNVRMQLTSAHVVQGHEKRSCNYRLQCNQATRSSNIPEEGHDVDKEHPQPQGDELVGDPACKGPQPPSILLNAAEIGIQLCLCEVPGAAWHRDTHFR